MAYSIFCLDVTPVSEIASSIKPIRYAKAYKVIVSRAPDQNTKA